MNRVDTVHAWLRDKALPVGFFLTLAGFFITTNSHHFLNITCVLLLTPAGACLLCDREAWRLLRTAALWPWLAFMAYIAATQLWNGSPADAAPYTKLMGYILLFSYAVIRMVPGQEERVWQAFRWAAMAAAGSGLYSIWYYYGYRQQPLVFLDEAHRFHAVAIGNHLLTGNVYGLFLAVWLAEQLRSPHAPRTLALLCALPILAVVLLTQARSPLLGLFAAMFMLWLSSNSRYRVPVLVALVAGMGLLLVLFKPFLMRGFSHRPEIWTSAFRQAMETPWFGHGLGNEPLTIQTAAMTLFDTHNVPLAVFYYGGAAGLLLWLLLLASALRLVWQQRQTDRGRLCLLLLVYGLVVTQFEGGYFIGRPRENWLYLWLPLAMSLRLAWPSRDKTPTVN